MRRGYGVALAVVAVLVAVLIGVGAYNAGVHHGLAQGAEPGEVVRYWDGRGPGWGFFPFGLLIFPLLILAIFALFRFAFWGGRWGDQPHPHPMGPGGWAGGSGTREAFEDWHRREHERREGDPDRGERPDTA